MKTLTLNGFQLTLDDLLKIANGVKITIDKKAKKRILSSFHFMQKMAKEKSIYGVNTGFGYLAREKISIKDCELQQSNLLKSHAAGYGPAFSNEETRVAMALRLNSFLLGNSGVSYQLCMRLADLINHDILPVIPECGSVGASGDLAPLAHLALPLIGEGFVVYQGKKMPAKRAIKLAKLKIYKLAPKEGLALINGTQMMLAVGTLAFAKALTLLDIADKITALTFEALVGNLQAIDPLIHEARGQIGQMISAKQILSQLEGSYLFDKNTKREKVQDPYSLRCSPQVHGPCRDALRFVEEILKREWNAATDNPLIFSEEAKILSGGNFHGQYLAMGFDLSAMTLAEIGSISERRLELLLNPHQSGLPPFLVEESGINSGYMAAQYLSASLVNENKLLSNPASTDSIPGNAGVEDHVSMGLTAAKKFRKLVENLYPILATELIAAVQAIDLRQVKKLGKGTKELYKRVRTQIDKLEKDRIIADDINKGVAILKDKSCNG